MSTPAIDSLAFLTPGKFADDDPYTGLAETLQLFEYGERLGFDGAWIRQRHLEHGVGSAAVFLAAAGQRTERVELGTAVIPIGSSRRPARRLSGTHPAPCPATASTVFPWVPPASKSRWTSATSTHGRTVGGA